MPLLHFTQSMLWSNRTTFDTEGLLLKENAVISLIQFLQCEQAAKSKRNNGVVSFNLDLIHRADGNALFDSS